MTKKLLIVDDQTGITKVVALIARQLGMECKTLNSSATATEEFIDYRPDILILDMIMPEKDGIDVLNEVLLTGTPVRIIVTSGYGDAMLRLAKSVANFHASDQVSVLKKPVRRAEFKKLLAETSPD